MDQHLRKTDNGLRKYFSPGWAGIGLMILGYVVLLVASIKIIPVVAKDVKELRKDVTVIQTNYRWILKGIDDLKVLIKEK